MAVYKVGANYSANPSSDIAIGAPYDGNGKVFIYHGSSSGINTIPAQVRIFN